MKNITVTLMATLSIIVFCSSLLAQDKAGPHKQPFLFSHTKAQACGKIWLLMDELIEKDNVRCKEVLEIEGFPYLRATPAVMAMAKGIEGKYAQHEWLELLRRIDLQARYEELNRLSAEDLEKLCSQAGIDCFQGRIRAFVARCSAIIMGDEKRNPTFMKTLRSQALSSIKTPKHGTKACFNDPDSLDGLITMDLLHNIQSPSRPSNVRSKSYLERRIQSSKQAVGQTIRP